MGEGAAVEIPQVACGHAVRDVEICDGNLAYELAGRYNDHMPNTDDYIGVVISDVARLLRTEFDRRVRKLGITRAQWLALTRLHRHPGASHSELAVMLEVEKATAGRMIDRLEANGWVERRAEPDDGRVKRVFLTTEAERVHRRIWHVAEATVDDAMTDLSPRERKQLMTLLLRVKRTLVSAEDDAPAGKTAAVARRGRGHNGRVPT
jgi:MarR family transcriptional regulator, transcriptional regulator for hemolysin